MAPGINLLTALSTVGTKARTTVFALTWRKSYVYLDTRRRLTNAVGARKHAVI